MIFSRTPYQWGSVTHQMAVPVPSISCCVLNHHDLSYQLQNALFFNRYMCCHLELCLWLLPFNWVLHKKELKGQIFYAYCISATPISAPKRSAVVANTKKMFNTNWNIFLELTHVSLRYDKRQKFARLFIMFVQISPSFANMLNESVSGFFKSSKCDDQS